MSGAGRSPALMGIGFVLMAVGLLLLLGGLLGISGLTGTSTLGLAGLVLVAIGGVITILSLARTAPTPLPPADTAPRPDPESSTEAPFSPSTAGVPADAAEDPAFVVRTPALAETTRATSQSGAARYGTSAVPVAVSGELVDPAAEAPEFGSLSPHTSPGVLAPDILSPPSDWVPEMNYAPLAPTIGGGISNPPAVPPSVPGANRPVAPPSSIPEPPAMRENPLSARGSCTGCSQPFTTGQSSSPCWSCGRPLCSHCYWQTGSGAYAHRCPTCRSLGSSGSAARSGGAGVPEGPANRRDPTIVGSQASVAPGR